MSLELIREAVKVNQVIGEDMAQAVIENDIIVPDVKPDIARVLFLDGDVTVNSTEVMPDRITVNGAIQYKILYISDNAGQNIQSINTNSGFVQNIDVNNAKQGAKCQVRCEIEHIDHNILNGRKINIKAIIKMNGKVVGESDKDIISDVKGLDEIQVLKENMTINSHIGNSEATCTIREELEVPQGKPAIKDILRSDVKVTGMDYKITDNKVIVKGELNISTLYTGTEENNNNILFMEHAVPFTQFVDLYGVNENNRCELECQLIDSEFEPGEDGDGELRMLNGEMVLKISVSASARKNIEVIADAYSPYAKLTLEKETFRTEEIAAESRSQIVLKDTLVIDEYSPEITEVFNILSKPVVSAVRISDDRLAIEGVLENNILYLAANDDQEPVCCYKREVPFKHGIEMKGVDDSMNCEINLETEHCNYSMISSSEVEIRIVINVNAKVVKEVVQPMVARIAEYPMDDRRFLSQPSMVIYFTQPGDTYWKIAKKYYTAIDDIKRVNGINERELINPGQQILVMKRYRD